jgi:quercetin dioxygenase-like cupin family protein
MIQHRSLIAAVAIATLVASACGGALAPASSASNAAAASASPTKLVVPASAQGSTSAKLTENKLTVTNGVPVDLPPGNYVSTVSLVTLEKGGRTVAHKHGGIEAIYVLQGSVDFRTAGGTRVTLTHGQGAAAAPNTALQAVNVGDGTAQFLAFFMTQDGAAFQTNIDEAP